MEFSFKKSSFDQDGWVIGIRRNLEQELEEEMDIPVTIFNVPKSLLLVGANCYVPQQVAIGPYNRFSSEQLEMQRYKISAAKRMQKKLNFNDVVDEFKKHDLRIRARYQRFIDLNQEALAWMMAMDTCFLLDFLGVFAQTDCTKTAHDAILRDVVMMENQIPLFALRRVLEMQLLCLDSADQALTSILVGLCKMISPFRVTDDLRNAPEMMVKSAHLLDFLYYTLVPRSEGTSVEKEEDAVEEQEEESGEKRQSFLNQPDTNKKFLSIIWKGISTFTIFKPVQVLSKIQENLKDPLEDLFTSLPENAERAPTVEEIGIPSISDLSNAGVKFAPIYTGILGINFDARSRTLYLPMISVDINSEVVLRNLVAYEACNASGPLVFTRYTELMNGIIDSVEDVKILRQNGIVVNHLKRDSGVMKLWNGMSKSIRLTKVDFLDKTIADVNKFYEGRWKVRFKKFLNRYVFESWKIFTLLGAILMLILMSVQAFCDVYRCPRMGNQV